MVAYAIISEGLNHAITALLGANLMMIGALNQQAAIRGVDCNPLGLFTGMMGTVAITRGWACFIMYPCSRPSRSKLIPALFL